MRVDISRNRGVAEAWTHAHVSDKGLVDASAGTTVRYAAQIGASGVQVFADVKKKHASHALTSDLTAAEVAGGLAEHGADAVVVTGPITGKAPTEQLLHEVRRACSLPVVIGSGITLQNAPRLFPIADAVVVGTSVKAEGNWRNRVDPGRARDLARCVEELR